jgi:F0F1-type ATP synthase assembly protein I
MKQSDIDAIKERITQEARYMDMINQASAEPINTIYIVYVLISFISGMIFGFILGKLL